MSFNSKVNGHSLLEEPADRAVNKMKAIVISAPGGPEVLHLREVGDPELRDEDVLINVAAAALNRADTFRRKGSHPPPPAGASPYLGIECSGTILAAGKNVSRWKIGDQVVLALVSVQESKLLILFGYVVWLLRLGRKRSNQANSNCFLTVQNTKCLAVKV